MRKDLRILSWELTWRYGYTLWCSMLKWGIIKGFRDVLEFIFLRLKYSFNGWTVMVCFYGLKRVKWIEKGFEKDRFTRFTGFH